MSQSYSRHVIGTPLSPTATRVLLCGAGELGKEVAVELQRYGVEVIAVDRYAGAPAMQVAHRSHVVSMLDGSALRTIIEKEKPDYIVPEIEAIATDTLVELEQEGFRVVPSARAAQLTMNREGIRRLAAETLSVPTSSYGFASSLKELGSVAQDIGFPFVIKPIMSSSGKGQSVVKSAKDIESAWLHAQEGGRAGRGRVIVESFVEFDFEITLLTIQTGSTCLFCEPIGHSQVSGDYRTSWQPQSMSDAALEQAQHIAAKVTKELGGQGLFGVELFVKGDAVIFSEVSPRPHDTGLVTLISQNLSQFALHARAILGLPIPSLRQLAPSASSVILGEGQSSVISYQNLDLALAVEDTEVRLFGKPEVQGCRRMGVALAQGSSTDEAVKKATAASQAVHITLHEAIQ